MLHRIPLSRLFRNASIISLLLLSAVGTSVHTDLDEKKLNQLREQNAKFYDIQAIDDDKVSCLKFPRRVMI